MRYEAMWEGKPVIGGDTGVIRPQGISFSIGEKAPTKIPGLDNGHLQPYGW